MHVFLYFLSVADSCKFCCKAGNGTCSVFSVNGSAPIDQSDGKPCAKGYCEAVSMSISSICTAGEIPKKW